MAQLTLATLGWCPDMPSGNRLRWSYQPERDTDLPLLNEVIVERAPLPAQFSSFPLDTYLKELAWLQDIPQEWWQSRAGRIDLHSSAPLVTYSLDVPVQAIAFRYEGPSTRCVVLQASGMAPSLDRIISTGELVITRGAALTSIQIFTAAVSILELHVLNLCADFGLLWSPIANIRVQEGIHASFGAVQSRMPTGLPVESAELLPEWWDSFTQYLQRVGAPGEDPHLPPPRDRAAVAIAARFWIAVLAGSAMVDGPRDFRPEPDDYYMEKLLMVPSTVAYRVRSSDPSVRPSNVSVCRSVVPPLEQPTALGVVDAEVRYSVQNKRDRFDAKATISWRQTDFRATGVRLLEEISSSTLTGSPGVTLSFDSYPSVAGPNGTFSHHRSFEVASFDVNVRYQLSAIDGWDRQSPATPWLAWTPLKLVHRPTPPPFLGVRHDRDRATLLPADAADWRPDRVVQAGRGVLSLFRSISAPRVQPITIGTPVPLAEALYKVSVTGLDHYEQFENGSLFSGQSIYPIVTIESGFITISAPADRSGTAPIPAAGMAALQQNPTHADLWRHVTDLPLDASHSATVIDDPASLTEHLVTYRVALRFAGQLGPMGPPLQAILSPVLPSSAPSIRATLLVQNDTGLTDTDAFGRTGVVVEFLERTPITGRFSVWWATGAPTDFAAVGLPGLVNTQAPHNGRFLYDVLGIPIPLPTSGVTIGVRAHGDHGSVSPFVTTLAIIPA